MKQIQKYRVDYEFAEHKVGEVVEMTIDTAFEHLRAGRITWLIEEKETKKTQKNP